MVEHCVKCWPGFFDRLADGTKTFEVRKNDRGYQCGDSLLVEEWDPMGITVPSPVVNPPTQGKYTGRMLRFRIGYVFSAGFGCNLGDYVVLSLLPPDVPLDASSADTTGRVEQ